MKLLVIGVDGGDRRIFEAMRTPNLLKLCETGRCFSLAEDIWSRGWAKTLTGASGPEMGGFYMKPKCDGTRDFIESFRGDDYVDPPNFTPIWKRLNDAGQTVGMMNVPTTSPVPEVDGFIVGGAGGGRGATTGIDPKTCWPRSLALELQKKEYMFDTRFLQVNVANEEEFFTRLKGMAEKRTDVFIDLCREKQVDFGYLAYMSTSRAQYLAMSELEPLMARVELAAAEISRAAELRPIQELLIDLFQSLDKQIGRLLEKIQPEHWMLVADHGAVPMHYKVNLNAFLRSMGLQMPAGSAGLKSSIKALARAVVPRGMRRTVGKKAAAIRQAVSSDTNWPRTKALSHRFYGGIYVHDQQRFGGPVASDPEIAKLTDQIVEAFNASPEAKEHHMTATAYRRQFPQARFERQLPDVFVQAPDGYFFEKFGPFVERNQNYRPIDSLSEVTNDMFSGMKGKHPIFCVDQASAEHVHDDDPDDLRLAYRVMERVMASYVT